jgi:hypothetical protein
MGSKGLLSAGSGKERQLLTASAIWENSNAAIQPGYNKIGAQPRHNAGCFRRRRRPFCRPCVEYAAENPKRRRNTHCANDRPSRDALDQSACEAAVNVTRPGCGARSPRGPLAATDGFSHVAGACSRYQLEVLRSFWLPAREMSSKPAAEGERRRAFRFAARPPTRGAVGTASIVGLDHWHQSSPITGARSPKDAFCADHHQRRYP